LFGGTNKNEDFTVKIQTGIAYVCAQLGAGLPKQRVVLKKMKFEYKEEEHPKNIQNNPLKCLKMGITCLYYMWLMF